MKQLVITIELEDNINPSLINSTIKMIKGVKKILSRSVKIIESSKTKQHRLAALDKLAGSISLSNIDQSDERTQYLLRK